MAFAIEASKENLSTFEYFSRLPSRIVTDKGRVLIQKRPFFIRVNTYTEVEGPGIQLDTIQIGKDNSLTSITSLKLSLQFGRLLSDSLPKPNPEDILERADRIIRRK